MGNDRTNGESTPGGARDAKLPTAVDQSPRTQIGADLVTQIVDSCLRDGRVTEQISAAAIAKLRKVMLVKKLGKPDEITEAANHEEDPGESSEAQDSQHPRNNKT